MAPRPSILVAKAGQRDSVLRTMGRTEVAADSRQRPRTVTTFINVRAISLSGLGMGVADRTMHASK